jgi:hypothetical protein
MSEQLAQLKKKGGACELSIPDTNPTGTIIQSGTTVSCIKGEYYLLCGSNDDMNLGLGITGATIIGYIKYQRQYYYTTVLIKTTGTSFYVTSTGLPIIYKKIEIS